MCRNRLFPFRNCRRRVNNGHRRSLATWGGVSRNLRGCVRQLSSVSIRVGRAAVYTVGYDQVWYVSACGKISFGLGTVVAVPSVVVHRLEGHASGLHGSHSRSTWCSVGDQVGQPRTISSAVDGYMASVVGLVDHSALGDFDRCAPVQWHPPVAGAPS